MVTWITKEIEDWLGLTINDDKTSIKRLRKGDSLDFLGYTFRYVRSLFGFKSKFLKVAPSKKAIKKARASIKAMTGSKYCFKPATTIIHELNMFLRGWSNYFSHGYRRDACQQESRMREIRTSGSMRGSDGAG